MTHAMQSVFHPPAAVPRDAYKPKAMLLCSLQRDRTGEPVCLMSNQELKALLERGKGRHLANEIHAYRKRERLP